MFLNRCGICLAPLPAIIRELRICRTCAQEIRALSNISHDGSLLVTLFQYRGPVRDLIIRAKVRSDHRALDLLQAITLAVPKALHAANWADAIMACPSSLWGRLRGRLDLAHHLASGLAVGANRPLLDSAPQLYWRLKKRAQNKATSARRDQMIPPLQLCTGSRGRWEARVLNLCEGRPKLLIVDDVITTGHTLQSVIATIPDGCRIKVMTLAASAEATRNFIQKEFVSQHR